MRRRTIVLTGLLAATLLGLGLVRAEEPAEEELFRRVAEAMADRRFADAEQRGLECMRRFPAGKRTDEAGVLVLRARMALERWDDAVDLALGLLDASSRSPWRMKVRYLLAEAHARAKGFEKAAAIYRDRVETLAAADHQAKIAADYLALATTAYEGVEKVDEFGRTTRLKDHRRALRFFLKARSIHVDEKDRASLRHRIADCQAVLGDHDAAIAEWKKLLEEDPETKLRPEVLFRIGDSHLERGRREEARRALREVVEKHADHERVPEAVILLGASFDPARTSDEEAFRQGVEWWREFLTKYFGHEKAPQVFFSVAAAYQRRGDDEKAIETYRAFLSRFGEHEKAPEAQYRIGEAHLHRREFDRAIEAWKAFLGRWPNHGLWTQAQERIVEADYLRGELAWNEERWDDAEGAWTAFLTKHPVAEKAPLVQLRLGDIEAKRENVDAAIARWRIVATKYPKHGLAPRALLLVARAVERDKGDLEAALEEYEEIRKRYPRSGEARAAAQAVAEMKAKRLEVVTKRAYRTDEKPTLHVRLRNVPELRFKAYRLDLEEYFRRKMHVASIEDVVVAIVKADEEWTWKQPEYRPYLPVEREIELPLEGPGAWIVTCAEDDLTATTLVLRSDLQVVVKQSARQVFAFVTDERTGRPAPGARLILADGEGVFAEGKTGEDGTFVREEKEKDRRDVRVLALREAHAATTAGVARGGTTWGYSTKGYLYTDRPLYRPGQTVEFRGILRKVAGGNYATPHGEKVKVWIADPRGSVLFDKELVASDYGTVSGRLDLPDEAHLGDYVLRARYRKQDFQAGFQVMEYRKPEFTAAIETARPTYLAGETVEAAVKLRYTFGGPVANVAARYEIYRMPFAFDADALRRYAWFFSDPERAEERRRQAWESLEPVGRGELKTDAKGEATFSFETERVERDRAYVVIVRAQDVNRSWISDQKTVFVTRKGYFAVVRTDQRVVQPKEAVRATITTVDARQMPVAAKGEIVIARRRAGTPDEKRPGGDRELVRGPGSGVVYEPVARYPVETGPDGKGEVTFRVEKAGEHLVRFEGVDRAGGAVLSSVPLDVAGEAEDLAKQAKIVAEREVYMEGDTARVLVNSPVAPALALVTYEGEKVLGHLVVPLAKRSTTLELPMEARFSPNVFLKVAIAADGELHQDEEEVAVLQFLRVEVETSAREARPGETVEATVRTTDQKGRPVAAELSLAVVDGSIFALAPDATPDIKPFFYDQRRKNAVATGSSHAFRYEGTTRQTNKDLLDEEARRLGAQAYEAMRRFVREGKEAQERGDLAGAVRAYGRALQISPDNYEAREALRRIVMEHAEGRDAGNAEAGEKLALVQRELQRLQERSKGVTAGKAARPGAPAPEPSAEAAPTEDARAASRKSWGGDRRREAESKDEDLDLEEAEKDAPAFGRFRRNLAADKKARPRMTVGFIASGGEEAHGGPAFVPPTLRQTFADTARWWPSVRTGEDGRAKLEVKLPDNLTTWRLTARGVSSAALVGEARATVTARKPMLVRIDAPRFLTQGDRSTITSTVHNNTGAEADVRVEMDARNVDLTGATSTGARLPDGGRRAFDWKLAADGIGLVRLEAKALGATDSDAVLLGLPTLPFGDPRRDGRSGVVEEEALEVLERPEEIVPGTLRFVLTISPDVDASLFEGLAFLERFPYGCLEQSVNRFLPALAARNGLSTLGLPEEELKRRLDAIVEQGLNSLYAFQHGDGSFGWWRNGRGDPNMTAFALLALERARLAGYRVDGRALDRARDAAARLVRGGDNLQKVWLLRALALGGKADFGAMNAVYRYRDGLPPAGLAALALAFRDSGRAYNAHELVRMLLARVVIEGDRAHWASGTRDRRGGFLDGDVETTALALTALLRLEPTSPVCDQAARWLEERRRGPSWGSTKATGAAIRALAAWQEKRRAARHDFVVEVHWNGKLYQKVAVRGGAANARERVVLLDEARFRAGRNELRLVRRGSGTFRYALDYGYVVPAKTIPAGGNLVTVSRRYVEAPKILREKETGERVPDGWTIVRPEARPAKPEARSLDRAGSGDRFRVVLKLTAREALDYVIVEDPLPAGVEVVEGQTRGPFDHQERRDEKQVFFLSRVKAGQTIELSYLCQAIHPGSYRALPARAYPMYEPEVFGRTSEQPLVVAVEGGIVGRRGEAESLSPDGLFHLAKKDFVEERWERARDAFAGLVRDYRLIDGYHEECLWYLMKCAFELEDAKAAVEAYEALRERNPRRGVVTREEKMALASSYVAIREHERALVLYRDLTDGLFAQEAEVASTYRQLGDPHRAQETLAALLLRYPDSGRVVAAEWELALVWADLPRPTDEKAPGFGETPRMLPEALEAFRAFLAHHPEREDADQAAYRAIDALQRMQRLEEAVAEAEAFRRRFPASTLLAKVTYDLCRTYFDRGEFARAREVAKEILTREYRWDRAHRKVRPSEFRPHVTFLLGQMAHTEGRFAEAVEHYRKVAGKFADARDALAFFTSTGLRLPESVVCGTDEPASVKLETKNLEKLDLKVYEVDLMILFAVRKDLKEINRIDLTGIVPVREWSVHLAERRDFRWREERVPVPAERKGVYLVVAKGGGHDGSTVVIKSDLEIKVQRVEDRVRVYAFHRRTREPVRGVYVKVGDGSVIRGHGLTDARGVFEVRGVRGAASVVAEKDGDYALHR
jgi:uncharacterized protein YfaS (alpha-2-macroglobulin family)/TolA-binding protein